MPRKKRSYVDDCWAVWIDGDDTSTVYINDWVDPKGKNYVDFGMRIGGVKDAKSLNVYIPFELFPDEIEDISLHFKSTKILQATFNAACIIDYMKNEHTSEVAFNGKTMDIVHISTLEYKMEQLAGGTRLTLDMNKLQPFLVNDEAYIIWRMPHKSLNEVFKWYIDGETILSRLRDFITSPMVTEKYGYSIRINESRLLPEVVTRVGAFHRQKLKTALITISINDSYEVNDNGCFRIRRLEENLYKDYHPQNYPLENVVTYEWEQNHTYNLRGQFNFYNSISRNSVNHGSMLLYLLFVLAMGVLINYVSNTVFGFFGWF